MVLSLVSVLQTYCCIFWAHIVVSTLIMASLLYCITDLIHDTLLSNSYQSVWMDEWLDCSRGLPEPGGVELKRIAELFLSLYVRTCDLVICLRLNAISYPKKGRLTASHISRLTFKPFSVKITSLQFSFTLACNTFILISQVYIFFFKFEKFWSTVHTIESFIIYSAPFFANVSSCRFIDILGTY